MGLTMLGLFLFLMGLGFSIAILMGPEWHSYLLGTVGLCLIGGYGFAHGWVQRVVVSNDHVQIFDPLNRCLIWATWPQIVRYRLRTSRGDEGWMLASETKEVRILGADRLFELHRTIVTHLRQDQIKSEGRPVWTPAHRELQGKQLDQPKLVWAITLTLLYGMMFWAAYAIDSAAFGTTSTAIAAVCGLGYAFSLWLKVYPRCRKVWKKLSVNERGLCHAAGPAITEIDWSEVKLVEERRRDPKGQSRRLILHSDHGYIEWTDESPDFDHLRRIAVHMAPPDAAFVGIF